jgi:RNA 2',3'-cyclic 3'-phosphodiesterase
VTQRKNETWRVFCAIELPSLVIEKISEHIMRLRAAAPDSPASWSRPENVHLTLKFIGEIGQNRVADLSQAAAAAVAGFSPFEILIKNTGSFPKQGTPRVFWIGVDDYSEKLKQLQGKLEDECVQLGFAREARTFNPHLTIARGRKPRGAPALAALHKEMGFESINVIVKELTVIRSELSSAGSNYTVISRHALAGNHRPA